MGKRALCSEPSFNSHTSEQGGVSLYLHFTDEEVEAQRVKCALYKTTQ